MTKTGWDQNAPLKRSELELIGTINHDGSPATNNLSHTINIPMIVQVTTSFWPSGMLLTLLMPFTM